MFNKLDATLWIGVVTTLFMFIVLGILSINKSVQNLEDHFENHTLFENGEPTDGFPDLIACNMAITAMRLRGTRNNHICIKDAD